MKYYLKSLKHYADFTGRASRTEYWIFLLIHILFSYLTILLDNVLNTTISSYIGFIYLTYSIALFPPLLAISVRRLHDIGKNGTQLFLTLIPIIGQIWIFILLIRDSSLSDNQYGITCKDTKLISKSNSDTIALLIISLFITDKFIWKLIDLIFDNYNKTALWGDLIRPLYALIWYLIPLGLAFIINDKSKRIWLFILAGLYFLYCLFVEIEMLTRPISNIHFQF